MSQIVSICSVGTEVVLGDQVDSNAAWLSQRLRELGIEVRYHLAAGDRMAELTDALRWLVDRSDVVLVGGGLGPTPDDLTREAIAEVAGVALESRAELEEAIIQRFADLGARMPPDNLRQAQVPAGAQPYDPVGTAPAFRIEVPRDGREPCVLYALPGVPWELQALYDREVQPDLLARTGGGASVTRVVHVSGMGESTVSELLAPLVEELDGSDGLALSFLATGDEIQVRLTASGPDPDAAAERTEPHIGEVRRLLGRAVTGIDDQSIEQILGELLHDAGETVAFAESATAGAACARMARIAGASRVLKGGAVVYATDSKVEVLGVPEDLLDEHGPVSDPVTRELAARVRELFGSDWGVAITGVAGPGTQNGLPIGTVVWAVAAPDGEVHVRSGRLPGDREAIQRRLVASALESLRRRLVERTGGV